MDGDMLFTNIDPGYNIGLQALEELGNEGRLEILNQQRSWLEAIQSDVDGDKNILTFGGENARPDEGASAFGQTASAVFRMVMLRAVQIREDWWPELHEKTTERNKNALRFQVLSGSAFKLLDTQNDNKDAARRYWRKYDHAFPPSLIESEVSENHGSNVNFHNKMLIFRNNFSEVVEIVTHAHATMDPLGWNAGEFDSYVQVECIQREIKSDVGKEGESFKKLKELVSKSRVEQTEENQQRGRGKVLDLLENVRMDNLSDQVKNSPSGGLRTSGN
jgi:hypothetical protein